MNGVLLDTHVLLWWLQGGGNLSAKARDLIVDPAVQALCSAASAWEIAIKSRAGKLDDGGLLSRFHSTMDSHHFVELQISSAHAIRAGLLKGSHKDPFDRMLAAQAQIENLPILSNDKALDGCAIRRIW